MIIDASARKIRSVGGKQSGKARAEFLVAIMFARFQCPETGTGVQLFLVCVVFASSATGIVSFSAMHSPGCSLCNKVLMG